MTTLLQTLMDEHRSIAAVLHAMEYLVRNKRERGDKIDPRVFSAMLYYLDVFSERMHHPKEETYLFDTLRNRTDAADAVLEELGREHAAGERAIRDLEQSLLRYIEGGDAEFAAFEANVERFVELYREHMRKEEQLVIPHARAVFTEQDWANIEAAFAANEDPLAGIDPGADYRKIFSRIVMLAPPPIGVGPAA